MFQSMLYELLIAERQRELDRIDLSRIAEARRAARERPFLRGALAAVLVRLALRLDRTASERAVPPVPAQQTGR